MTDKIPPLEMPDVTEVARKQPLWPIALVFVGATAVGYGAGSLLSSVQSSVAKAELSGLHVSVLIFGALLCSFLAILWHELGHVFGGYLAGFQFRMLVAGPLKILKRQQKLSVHINRNIGMMGGLALSLPTELVGIRRGLTYYIAAGPVFSLMLGLLGIVVVFYWPVPTSAWPLVGWFLSAILAGSSLMIGLLTLIPGQTSALRTDGRQLLDLLQNRPSTEIQNLVRLTVGTSIAGTRPRDYDSEIMSRIESGIGAVSGQDRAFANSLLHLWAMDRNEVIRARGFLQQMLNDSRDVPTLARRSIFLSAAYFEAAVRDDAEAAEAFFKVDLPNGLADDYQVSHAEAAVACAHEDVDRAMKCIADARTQVSKSVIAGETLMHLEQLDQIEATLNGMNVDEAAAN